MNSQSLIGYVVALLGIVVYLFSFASVASALSIPAIPSRVALIAMAVLVVVGLFLVVKSSKSQEVRDIPIYEGKELVGYRRHRGGQ